MKAGTLVSAIALALVAVGVNARAVGSDGKVLIAYLPYWDGVQSQYMDHSKITHLYYAFANVDSTGAVTIPPTDTSIINTFAAGAHAGQTQAILSIGGWGIQPFSTVFNTASGINTFVSTISALLTKYNLDGVDIDWEYPGEQGACQDPWAPNDTDNFLTALKALRAALPNKLITAAPPAYPWKDATGNPMKDASAFAQVFDFVNLMAYDLNGIWGTYTGASAPLVQDKGNLGTPQGNVKDAVDLWLAAGFPANKLVLGTAFYGHYMSPVSPMTNNKDADVNVPVQKGSTGHDCAGAGLGGTYTFTQVYPFTQDTTGEWIKHFDTWTQTPWIYNTKTNLFVSYDDARSITIKAAYAACRGLKGVMTWEATLDGGALMPALSTFFSATAGAPGTDCVAQVASITSAPQPSPTNVGPAPTDVTTRCGISWTDANTNCYALCTSNAQCAVGQNCYNALNACSSVKSTRAGANGWVSEGACSTSGSSATTSSAIQSSTTTTTTVPVPTTSTSTTTNKPTTSTTTTTVLAPTTFTTTAAVPSSSTTTTTTNKPTSTTTTTIAIASTTIASGTNCFATWDINQSYPGGSTVSYNNVNYKNTWWENPGAAPGAANSDGGWVSQGNCGGQQTTSTTTTTVPVQLSSTTTTTTVQIKSSTTTTTTFPVKSSSTTTTTIPVVTTTAGSGGPVVGGSCSTGTSQCSAGTMYFCQGVKWIIWYTGC
ncbi:UNVERIFIED_CONTAM: hypothetical protein HDU68_003578 [Siphonaria sp. JEL0065]|nr:hypothetical protein HDU68_003578 [Siphonaria sp. JEL0065]